MSSAPEGESASASDSDPVSAAILAAVAACPHGKTLCPGEVARVLSSRQGDQGAEAWRAWLKPVRRSAIALARANRIGIYRKGRPVGEPDAVKGVIRLGHPSSAGEGGSVGR
jgi:hypothetical protein